MTKNKDFKQVWEVLARTKTPEQVVFGSWLAPRYSRKLDLRDLGTIEKQLEVSSGQTILDLGCGALGRALIYLAERRLRTVGVDVSPTAVAKARKTLEQRSLLGNVDLVVADAEYLPFKEGTFDRVLSIALVSHLPARRNILKTLREIRFCMKTDGLCYLNWWLNLYSPFSRLLAMLNRVGFIGQPRRIQLLAFKGEGEVKRLCEVAGLHVKAVIKGSVLWYTFHLLPQRLGAWSRRLIEALNTHKSSRSESALPAYFFDFIVQKGVVYSGASISSSSGVRS